MPSILMEQTAAVMVEYWSSSAEPRTHNAGIFYAVCRNEMFVLFMSNERGESIIYTIRVDMSLNPHGFAFAR